MVLAQRTTFSATPDTNYSREALVSNSSQSATDQFIRVLDELLGRSTKNISTDTFRDLDTSPGKMIFKDNKEGSTIKKEESFDESPKEKKEDKLEVTKCQNSVDATTASALLKKEQLPQEPIKEAQAESKEQANQMNSAKVVDTLTPEEKIASEIQKEGLRDLFKLVKQDQLINRREITLSPIDRLQSSIEENQGTGLSVPQQPNKGPNPTTESELQIEKLLDSKAEIGSLLSVDTKPNTLKEATSFTTRATAPVVGLNQGVRHAEELVRFATRESVGSKLFSEFSKEKNPLESLSLLGEKSKVQTTKETSKNHQLTSRQERIISQILKLVDQAAKLKDGTTLTLRIKPEELGEVLVKVSQRGDQLIARIIPEHKEVEHTVRSGINEVVAQLVMAGFRAENIHISVGREISESESFQAFQNLANHGSGENLGGQKSTSNGDRHSSGLNNSDIGGGGIDSRNATLRTKDTVENGWVA